MQLVPLKQEPVQMKTPHRSQQMLLAPANFQLTAPKEPWKVKASQKISISNLCLGQLSEEVSDQRHVSTPRQDT